MNENKTKEKHTLRNVLITLLVLCVLGGGGYFGYTKYLEYKTNQEEIAAEQVEYEEKVQEALAGVSEEDQAKLTEKNIKALVGGTSAGQERALNNYGIAADINERMDTVGNYSTTYVDVVNTTIEENTLVNCNEEKGTGANGETILIQVNIGDEDGVVIFDRLYEDNPSEMAYEFCEKSGLSKETVDEILSNYSANPEANYKSYELYYCDCMANSDTGERVKLKSIMVSDTSVGESRFIVCLYAHNQARLVLY